MGVLTIIVVIFLVLEISNVLALYFATGSDKFNALGVFKAWEASKAHPELHALIRYLAYWVAGTKLIFIFLMVVILWLGDARLQVFAVGALIASIASFWWRLFPLIRSIDADGGLQPAGYAKTLGLMILGFTVILITAAVGGVRGW